MASASRSSAGRPDTVAPNTTRRCPVTRDSSSAHAPCSTVFSVTCSRRAKAFSASVAAPSSRSLALSCPGCLRRHAEAGSAAASSVGSSTPDRRSRQKLWSAAWSRPASQAM